MTQARQNPEKLLKRVQEEERKEKRGKLKIYLGAAPGVGKTYAMLQDAHAEREEGLDVIIGIVESHEREEVKALIKDLEILPRKKITYHGNELSEFDLDGALKRNPGLILVDEMAHTNAPDSRHLKRWQDIKELLDRGIDVNTTLNIQHIESLSDDVAQIIHAPIKETVPDFMLELADTIELIDLPPEDLLERLQQGKVYIPEQAQIAVEHFFRRGNLTALRELALRATAQHVGTEVLFYRQGQGIKHVWPTKEKILVCVGPRPESLKLIRAARRMATSLKAEWIAVYVDIPQLFSTETNRNRAIQNLRLAEQLGAKTRILTGKDIIKEIMAFAREENVTQIMIWKHIRTRFREIFFHSLADEIVRNSGEIDVYIMTGEREEMKSTPPTYFSNTAKEKKPDSHWKNYVYSVFIVSMATLVNFFFFPYLDAPNLILIYLLGIIIVALRGHAGSAIVASILSIITFTYCFIPPFYTFAITDVEYLFSFFVMLLTSQIISHLTNVTHKQTETARFSENQTAALHTLSRQLANSRGIDKLLTISRDYLANLFDSDISILLPDKGELVIRSGKQTELSAKEKSIAQWVFDLGQLAGFGTDTLSFAEALYVPLLASQSTIGVMRICQRTKHMFTSEQLHLLESCAKQIALALEVDRLYAETTSEELKSKTDHAKNALLQSVSHDLRTPLISIIAQASTLIEIGNELDGNKIKKIGKDIYLESEQLSRLINNLLQISYLESEAIQLQTNVASVQDVINLVLKTSTKKLGKRSVNLSIPEDLPHVPFDHSLLQEVIINLIDNAIKFTPHDTPIEIKADIQKENIIISVEDYGPGIVADEVKKLFEKFYRGRLLTTERGLGLGLAICRSIINAHGGEIWAENKKDGGAAFRFSLPRGLFKP